MKGEKGDIMKVFKKIISIIKVWGNKICEVFPIKTILAVCIIVVLYQLNEIQSDLWSIESDVSSMQHDVSSIQSEVSSIKRKLLFR